MKVILIAAVSNLGRIGDVVEVKSGFAKNFLIPAKKAICFTVNNHKVFEAKKHEFEQANQSNLATATKLKEQVAGKDFIIIENASDDGRLYGSVNSSVIAAKINETLGAKSISRLDVFLKKPIKEIGVYEVSLAPHSEVSFVARVIVTRSESEVSALLKAEKKGDKKSAEEVSAPEAASETEAAPAEKAKKPRKKKAESESQEAAAE
jgi:large subunit ribosomal protein L9